MFEIANCLTAMMYLHSPEERIKEYRNLGVNIGKNVFLDYFVTFDAGYPQGITVENNACICKNVTILSHDSSLAVITNFPTICKKTRICENAYIGTGAIILPGVTIGRNTIVGAGSVVVHDLPENMVCVGSPCKPIKSLEQFIAEKTAEMLSNPEGIEYLHHVPESRPNNIELTGDGIYSK